MKGLSNALDKLQPVPTSSSDAAYKPMTQEQKLEQEISQLEKRIVGGVEVVIRRTLVQASEVDSKVVVHNLNKRSAILLSPRNIEKLVNDVKGNNCKINEPILCKYNSETGVYEAIDGSRRRKTASILEIDLPVEYFEEDLSDEVIKSHINSTNTSLDFSEYEKILIVKEEFETYKIENPDATDEMLKEYFLVLLEDAKLGSGRSSFFKFKSIITHMHESFFVNGRVNNIIVRQLETLASLIGRLKKNNPSKYTHEYVANLFSQCFDALEEKYGDVYTGKELIKELKEREGLTSSTKPEKVAPKPTPIVSNDDCEISLLEHDGKWVVSGDALMPKSFREGLEKLIKEHFE
ncbi:ParB N-terminal domain-containing protein [Vibrio coralliirubri]|uniref:ParB N-terminal domain-containing protein n=1 Tax=Vibrio coralliirubri TaxID=1516159 RepID=UPI0022853035|nr:ParB N-terminal domain-containing protein [Vibrio coralliirubri]MCY9866101.1 ParB N-terminal domain-containing protein [Vibrio coralliirubri]